MLLILSLFGEKIRPLNLSEALAPAAAPSWASAVGSAREQTYFPVHWDGFHTLTDSNLPSAHITNSCTPHQPSQGPSPGSAITV